jgi:hypothetical protein
LARFVFIRVNFYLVCSESCVVKKKALPAEKADRLVSGSFSGGGIGGDFAPHNGQVPVGDSPRYLKGGGSFVF